LPDLHGNLAAVVNAGETAILAATRYDPFGQTAAAYDSGASFPVPWRFQGRLDISPDSHPLYDFGARTYDPGSGAFTSLDTYAGSPADPLSLNRFAYAEANPWTLIDPDGHRLCLDSGDSCVGVGTSPTAPPPPSPPPTHAHGKGWTPPKLDPLAAYNGQPSKFATKTFATVEGMTGTIRIGSFISQCNILGFQGDCRGFETHFDPYQTRVSLRIDLDKGKVDMQVNPSCFVVAMDSCTQPHDINPFLLPTNVLLERDLGNGAIAIMAIANDSRAVVPVPPLFIIVTLSPGSQGGPPTIRVMDAGFPDIEVYRDFGNTSDTVWRQSGGSFVDLILPGGRDSGEIPIPAGPLQ
jgi:RHS repeat-associated protein